MVSGESEPVQLARVCFGVLQKILEDTQWSDSGGRYTPPKINIEPENDGLEDDLTFPGVYSLVPC